LIGATIKITCGLCEGSVVIVKDATETTARAELRSTKYIQQTILVDRFHVAKIGIRTKDGGFSSYNRTPDSILRSRWTDSDVRQRWRKSKIPMHGSQTPMYDSNTSE